MEEYGTPPKNWLVESILVTLFCCLPLGIVGIVNAANVNSRWAAGDHEGSERASAEAKKWTKIGFIIGIVGIVVYFILALTMGIGAAWMNLE
ncbi:MAG TPA: CD225/dispanin family protein [Saprospiraceae bacterium]|nr:CD225/dispanin family protein [Saprospiraceae bacterium]